MRSYNPSTQADVLKLDIGFNEGLQLRHGQQRQRGHLVGFGAAELQPQLHPFDSPAAQASLRAGFIARYYSSAYGRLTSASGSADFIRGGHAHGSGGDFHLQG